MQDVLGICKSQEQCGIPTIPKEKNNLSNQETGHNF